MKQLPRILAILFGVLFAVSLFFSLRDDGFRQITSGFCSVEALTIGGPVMESSTTGCS